MRDVARQREHQKRYRLSHREAIAAKARERRKVASGQPLSFVTGRCPNCGSEVSLSPARIAEYNYLCRDCRSKQDKRVTDQETARLYRTRITLKRRARWQAWAAVRDGRLIRKSCERCGNPKSEAHHDDYGEPLIVRWLCRRCHERHHCDVREACA